MRKRILCGLSAVIIAVSSLLGITAFASGETYNYPFADVKRGSWYEASALHCFEHGYMSGTTQGRFSPSTPLSRAMAVLILVKIDGLDISEYSSASSFTDVPAGTWYHDAVEWASHFRIVSGTGNGAFSPSAAVTRQDLAVILYSYYQYVGEEIVPDPADLTKFSDYDQISGYAEESLSWAVGGGLMAGTDDNRINPRGSATRAEAAVIFRKYENIYSHNWDEGYVVTPRTCTSDGRIIYTCVDCWYERRTIITKGGHVYGDDGICINCGEARP